MSMMTLLVVVTFLCVIGSLVLGIGAMVHHGEVWHRTSAQWMTMRVAFQMLALALILMVVWAG